MECMLLIAAGPAAMVPAITAAILFLLAGRPVEAVARELQGSARYAAGQAASLIANHDWYNSRLFAG